MSEIFQLVYRSRAAADLEIGREIPEILSRARPRNLSLGVTGLLIFRQGAFLQLLEGPEEGVRALFERIRLDRRHEEVVILAEARAAARLYDRWSMAYVDDRLASGSAESLFDLFDLALRSAGAEAPPILPILKRFLDVAPRFL